VKIPKVLQRPRELKKTIRTSEIMQLSGGGRGTNHGPQIQWLASWRIAFCALGISRLSSQSCRYYLEL
jgi:hypothetical protein